MYSERSTYHSSVTGTPQCVRTAPAPLDVLFEILLRIGDEVGAHALLSAHRELACDVRVADGASWANETGHQGSMYERPGSRGQLLQARLELPLLDRQRLRETPAHRLGPPR